MVLQLKKLSILKNQIHNKISNLKSPPKVIRNLPPRHTPSPQSPTRTQWISLGSSLHLDKVSSPFHSPSKITPPWTQESLIHFWGTRRENELRRVISIVSGTLEFILLDSWTISLTRSGLKEFNSFTNRTCLFWGSLEFLTLDTIILWVDLEFLWGELTSFVHIRVTS